MDYYEPRLPCDATQIGRFRAASVKQVSSDCSKPPSTAAVDIKASSPPSLSG